MKKILLGIIISAVVIISLSLVIFVSPFKSNMQIFSESLNVLVSKSQDLTKQYQEEVGKWNMKKLDNLTMVTITDKYLPHFAKLEKEARKFDCSKWL